MTRVLLVEPVRDVSELKNSPLHPLIKGGMTPLALPTIAALTPTDFEVDIWDETVRGRITPATAFPRDYAFVGVTGYSHSHQRVIQLSRIFRQRSIPIVVGGAGVSSEPHLYREHFDVLFIGEAEYTWPRFLADYRSGSHQREYRQVSKVDMADSPTPRWDKIAGDLNQYAYATVQTTRGCPFDCEYCDVISLYGRQPRHKSIAQVLHEVEMLEVIGASRIFIADDNLYGAPHYYKSLLSELAVLNRSFKRPLQFNTQITLNIAGDDEMLALLADANVSRFVIGIETPNKDSLIEANKPQNYKRDLVSAVKKIQSYGLTVEASMIVGFDHDDRSIFQRQLEFFQEASLARVGIHVLKAMPETKLWVRLHKENRVLETRRGELADPGDWRSITNVVPKRMTLMELLSGYRDLLKRTFDWRNFEERVAGFIDNVESYPGSMLRVRSFPWRMKLRLLQAIAFDTQVRRAIWGLVNDREAQATRKRLMRRVNGSSGRDRFLRRLVDELVGENQHRLAFELPAVIRGIDEELRRLAAKGLPPRERAVFLTPEAFRKPFKGVFPQLYRRVHQGLVDKSRVEIALVEVVYDFLARWGSTFESFEEHHRVQLDEICDRTIAKENADARDGNSMIGQQSTITGSRGSEELSSVGLKRLAVEVLRCAEEELRRVENDSHGEDTPVAGWMHQASPN